MAHLSEEEKAELLKASQSESLRHDMHKLRVKEKITKPYESETLEHFIQFATSINKLAGHPRKPFKAIKGDYFRL